MSEFDTRYIQPDFDPNSLHIITEHPKWQTISPNYPATASLLPRRLTSQDLIDILNGLKEGSPLTQVEKTEHPNKPQLALNDHLNLAFYDKGEARWCYLLTYENQRMAVLMGGYAIQEEFPEDPKITVVNYGLGKKYLSYSDLAAYLCLPVKLFTDGMEVDSALVFQEWGGEEAISSSMDPRIRIAGQRVRSYIQSHGYIVNSVTESELSHPRHYLLNQGRLGMPAVIDIPFEQNIVPS